MDITLYISTILQEQGEVGVPGLGTFYKENDIAHFKETNNTFYPPGGQLGFRGDDANNQALVEYISEIKHISTASAEYFAEKFGRELKKELQTVGFVSLGSLGTLRETGSGFAFQSKFAAINPSSFGLIAVEEPSYIPPVNTLPVEEASHIDHTPSKPTEISVENPPEPKQEQDEVLPVITADKTIEDVQVDATPTTHFNGDKAEVPVTEKKSDPINDPSVLFPFSNIFDNSDIPSVPLDSEKDLISQDEIESEAEPQTVRKRWIKEILAVIIVAGLTVAGYIYRDKLNTIYLNYRNKTENSVVITPGANEPTFLNDSISSADSIIDALKQQGLNPEKPLDTINVTTKAEDISAPGSVKSYEIIGPSFIKLSQAVAFIKKMHSKGIYAYVIKDLPGTRIKVGLGSFKDQQSASLELPRIQKDIYSNAFIQPIKNP